MYAIIDSGTEVKYSRFLNKGKDKGTKRKLKGTTK
jgi:hypothetical protein